jgi:predicted amidophosphoribosyltransferase
MNMIEKIKNKISQWLYERILTYPLWKYMRAHKYHSDVCKKCNQHPYSNIDRMCPVCGEEI